MELQELSKLNEEMYALKGQDPTRYLELLQQLNEILESLNADLKSI